MKEANKSTDST